MSSTKFTSLPQALWQHKSPRDTSMGRFQTAFETHVQQEFHSFKELHEYSTKHPTIFWDFLRRYSQLDFGGELIRVIDESARMDNIPRWFDGLTANFAENLLFSYGGGKVGKANEKIAVVEMGETGIGSAVYWTWEDLRIKTAYFAQGLKANGVSKGDRVVAVSSNNLNTLLVFLATTTLGAIFSSISTEMGVESILERLLQVTPRLVFMTDSALYNGKILDLRNKMTGIANGLDEINDFLGIIAMPRNGARAANISNIPKTRSLDEFLAPIAHARLAFERIPFSEPFMIAFSSGTSGQPKCIAHSVGGVLLNAFKEGSLHQEIDSNSVVLQYTTTSWIMYLVTIQNLMFGSRVILYDGSPLFPAKDVLIKIAEYERVTHLGISPRYLQELQSAGIKPREIADLSALHVVSSTGMILPIESFEWFYNHGFPASVRLNNMSGGTDIAGCFGISNPIEPVYAGGCSGLSLGIRVEVYDSKVTETPAKGKAVKDGIAGELVATSAFPNQPALFWGSNGYRRYRNAYFARYDNVWAQGDFVMIDDQTKQLIFLGRSDGILNPSGVRFGSSEIYNLIESQFKAEIAESICVGQRRPTDTDERVFLFIQLRSGVKFSLDLVSRVKAAIRKGLSPRHVPSFIFPTPEIPMTVNMKKVEIPVKQIISGTKITRSGTLLNPSSLDYYYQFVKVEELGSRLNKL